MQAGKLDRRITILRVATEASALNEPVETWNPLCTIWAAKEDIRDGERLRAQEVSAQITTRFRVRWSSVTTTIDARDRVQFGALLYDIFGVKEIGRRVGLEITAAARAEKVDI